MKTERINQIIEDAGAGNMLNRYEVEEIVKQAVNEVVDKFKDEAIEKIYNRQTTDGEEMMDRAINIMHELNAKLKV